MLHLATSLSSAAAAEAGCSGFGAFSAAWKGIPPAWSHTRMATSVAVPWRKKQRFFGHFVVAPAFLQDSKHTSALFLPQSIVECCMPPLHKSHRHLAPGAAERFLVPTTIRIEPTTHLRRIHQNLVRIPMKGIPRVMLGIYRYLSNVMVCQFLLDPPGGRLQGTRSVPPPPRGDRPPR